MSEKLIRDAAARLVIQQRLFGLLSLNLEPKEDNTVPTAATDGRYLYFNKDFIADIFDKFKYDGVCFIVAHEGLHPGLLHLFRRGSRDPLLWNAAGDYVINGILVSCGMKPLPGCLYDPKYDGWSTEQVYEDLRKQVEENAISVALDGDFVVVESKSGRKGIKGKTIDSHNKWGGAGQDESERRTMEKEWESKLTAAVEAVKSQGNVPASIARMVKRIKEPRVDWRSILAELVHRTSKDFTWSYPDRRLITSDVYLPSLGCVDYGDDISNAEIVIAVDTSGSIGEEELIQFLSEASGVVIPPTVIYLLACDAEVHYAQTMVIGEGTSEDEIRELLVSADLKGGGGTDFRPVFEWVEKNRIWPDAMVYFTDSYGTFPDKAPRYPVIWGIVGDYDVKVPFGIVAQVSLNPDRKPTVRKVA